MEIEIKKMYSEVYSILEMLGEFYINKIPRELFNMIKEEKLENYNPHYDFTEISNEQNMKRETISMLALLYLKFWCNSFEEKEMLKKLFNKNEEEYQKKIRLKNLNSIEKKFNREDKEKNNKTNNENNLKKEIIKCNKEEIMEYREPILKKIIDTIKKKFNNN